ncbi:MULTISPECIES: hypothetical protein [Chryseobacterium]|uniref:Uncharacterized protein n=1 Tax=Chryseobacterium sediminis TaxID=1679494 RepID=A0A5B2U8X8_9FLAO|nr:MULTISPECIES: hypothetical protein [Chryseobacterium]KAA2222989.1 hypothetical protein FW780_01955 [Chryseobacterium sediminis]CAD0220426.1 conserved protein of unknown function [Chryseobacterium sp. JV274]
MKSYDYLLLEKLLEKNRRMFRKKLIESEEYIDNHEIIMTKIKKVIFKFEKYDIDILQNMDIDETLERFRREIFLVKFNLN